MESLSDKWALGLGILLVLGGIATWLFLIFIRWYLDGKKPEKNEKTVPAWLTGVMERLLFTFLVAFRLGGLLNVPDAVNEADATSEGSGDGLRRPFESVPVEPPAVGVTRGKSNAIIKRFQDVMHWKDFLGFNQAVGTFTVYNDRFEFRSTKRDIDISFADILKISEGFVTLSIRTAKRTVNFSSDTFKDISMSSISRELQSYLTTST